MRKLFFIAFAFLEIENQQVHDKHTEYQQNPLRGTRLSGHTKSNKVYKIPQRYDHSNDFSRSNATSSSSALSRLDAMRNKLTNNALRNTTRSVSDCNNASFQKPV